MFAEISKDPFCGKSFQVCLVQRRREKVPLHRIAPFVSEEPQLRLTLDALGNNFEIESLTKLDQRMHNGPLFRRVLNSCDE
jgi:hypothetical protein